MMPSKEDLKSWEDSQELIRRMNTLIYGFDISKLSVQEQRKVEEQTKRRWELKAMKERLNPKPKPKLSKAEELEIRRLQALEAKFDKVSNGRPIKELSNNDLEKQLKVLRKMVKVAGV